MAADGTSMPIGSSSNLELMRQRAQKAAEFYQDQQKRQQQREKERKGEAAQRGQGQFADTYNNNGSSSINHAGDPGRGGTGNNISQVLSEESYDSVAPPTSNSFYRSKMRAGIIDMRSSYSERSGHSAGSSRMNSGMYHSQHTGPRVRTQTYALDNKQGYSHAPQSSSSSSAIPSSSSSSHQQQQQPAPQKPARTYATNRMLYRSSSDLEVDSGELDVPPPSSSNLHREYGSTSSLDILGTSTDNFFSMVSEFQHHNALDQRSPAPPRLQELLQGRLGANSEPQIPIGDSGKNSVKFQNGISQGGKELGEDEIDGKAKTKTKHKDRKQRAKSITGEASASILKKLRGKTESEVPSSKSEERVGAGDETSSASVKSEDSCRKRAFVHFDCQSVGVDLTQVIQNRSAGLNYKNNTTTGASAASGQRLSLAPDKDDADILADSDEGDGKGNDLVLSCPFFRNELGGEDERTVSLTRSTAHKRLSSGAIVATTPTVSQSSLPNQVRHPACCGVAILDSSPSPSGQILPPLVSHRGHVIEYVDHGSYYYRHFFYNYDHQNIFGIDDNLGPVAISVRREKLDLDERTNNLGRAEYGLAQYRIICRTSELSTLRGCLLEEAIPARLSSSRGIPIKDVLEVAVPEVQISCLRQAVFGPKTCDQLLKLDEQGIGTTYKVGIMYCKAGQGSEEEMYNNESTGPALEEFLNLISSKVRLKGFESYRGGLDCKTDTTGTHSYYTTFNNNEIMFHVSTMLPFTPNNKQQLLRKRHIGNDIVTVVFQEAGAQPFTPQTVRSQFQHVFIVVQVSNPNSENTRYSVAITRSKDVPPFGPPIPENCNFKKSQDFVDFLLAKVINSENAAHKSEKFRTMATRTRQEYLKDLATNYITNTPIDSGSKLSKFGLGSGRKKEKVKQKVIPDMYAKGALVWEVQVEDMGTASQVECLLAVAADTIVLLEQTSKDVIFTIPCSTLIGWTPQPSSLRLYFGAGECLLMRPFSGDVEEMHEIITRLQAVTNGIETTKMALKRNGLGQLGFHIQSEGIITDVEKYGYAWEAGLRKGSRLVEICKVATTTLSHDQIVDLLRTSVVVKVVVVPPMDNGSPRGFVTHSSLISPSPTSDSSQQQQQNSEQQQLSPNQDQEAPVGSNNPSPPPSSTEHQPPRPPDYHQALLMLSQARGDTSITAPLPIPPLKHSPPAVTSQQHHHQLPHQQQQQQQHYEPSPRPRPSHTHHGYSDSTLSSGRSSDDGRGSSFMSGGHARQESGEGYSSYRGSQEDIHSRNNSHDSSDYAMSGVSSRSRSSNQPPPLRRGDRVQTSSDNLLSGNSSSSNGGNKRQFANMEYTSGIPTTGNIAFELLKQTQNTKYLLGQNQGQSSSHEVSNNPGSASNLSQISEGSSSNSSLYNQRGNSSREELVPKRKDGAGRPNKPSMKKGLTEPSANSPRAQRRNFTGMASEEFLASNLRGASSQKLSRQIGRADFQEELMRLIDPDLSEKDLVDFSNTRSGPSNRRVGRLQRTLSDESLHNSKGAPIDLNRGMGQNDDSIHQRLSPRAVTDFASARQRSKSTIDNRFMPVLESTAALDWSKLVNVASRAIDDTDSSTKVGGKLSDSLENVVDEGREDSPPPRPPSPQMSINLSSSPSSLSQSYVSMSLSPQQKVQELETRLSKMQQHLDKVNKEKMELEAKVHDLTIDNNRLQEESQTAATKLRKFTEWFFNTIDRQ